MTDFRFRTTRKIRSTSNEGRKGSLQRVEKERGLKFIPGLRTSRKRT